MKQKNETQFELEIRRRVEAKYDERNSLLIHLISFAGVNVLVWLIWLLSTGGFPWPLFITLFWGIGMAGHMLDYYNKHGGGAEKREERIQEEVQRHLQRLAERERQIYGDDQLDDTLNDVQRRHLRLSDDGELVHLDGLAEDEAVGEQRPNR
jgi:hypothetical protein